MALDYNRFAGSLLSSLGSGLMASGGQGGWNNFAPGFAQGQQQFQQNQFQQQNAEETSALRQLQQQQLQMQLEAQRTANQDRVKQQQAMEKLLGGGMMSPNGMSQSQFGGTPVEPGLMSQNFDPQQLQYLQALPPEQSAQILGETLFKEPTVNKPSSSIAKIQDDLAKGFITPAQAEAAIKKETYISPPASMFPAIPSGYQVTAAGLMPIPGGPADPAVKMAATPPTESQQKAEQLATRAEQQLPTVLDNWDALGDPKNQAASILPGPLATVMTSGEFQQANNALLDIASSYLYSVSGAQAPESEVQRLVATVRPKLGESETSKADKKERVKQMVESISLKRKPGAAAIPPGVQPPVTDLKAKYGLD